MLTVIYTLKSIMQQYTIFLLYVQVTMYNNVKVCAVQYVYLQSIYCLCWEFLWFFMSRSWTPLLFQTWNKNGEVEHRRDEAHDLRGRVGRGGGHQGPQRSLHSIRGYHRGRKFFIALRSNRSVLNNQCWGEKMVQKVRPSWFVALPLPFLEWLSNHEH